MSTIDDLAERWAEQVRTLPEAAAAPVRRLPLAEDEEPLPRRPATRGECAGGARPCPFVSCRHHLYLDVSEKTGVITFNAGALDVWEMPESCSLDVAERGGRTLKEIAAFFTVTRERIRQIEDTASRKVARRARDLRAQLDQEIRRGPAPRLDDDGEEIACDPIDDDE